jgi:hypothetical protein
MGTTESPKLPRGVTIRKHSNGETINITFTYKGLNAVNPFLIWKFLRKTLNMLSEHSEKSITKSKEERLFMQNTFPVLPG